MSSAVDAIARMDAVLVRLERALLEADLAGLLDCERDLAGPVQGLAAVQAIEAADRGPVRDRLLVLQSTLSRCRRLGRSLHALTGLGLAPAYPAAGGGRRRAGGDIAVPAHALEEKI